MIKNKVRRLMKLNKFFADTRVLVACCVLGSLLIFFGINYAVVSILNVGDYFNNTFTSAQAFGLRNAFVFNAAPGFIYPFILLFIVIANVRYIWLIKINYKELNIGQKGVARWTTFQEIQEQYKEIPQKTEFYEGNGGVPVCRYKDKIYIDDSPVNNLVLGLTRSGKGEMYVFPTIDIYSRAEHQPSLIVTDPKLELCASSQETLKKRGYEVHILNLLDPLKSSGFNPLQLILDAYKQKKYSEAELLCSSFCYSIFNPDEGEGDSQFWANASTNCLSALILAHIEDCLGDDEKANAERLLLFKKKQAAFSELGGGKQLEIRQAIANGGDADALEALPPEVKFLPTNENEKKINMYSILNTFSVLAGEQIDEFKTALDVYFDERPAGNRARLKFAAANVAGSRTKGSIFANTLAKLTIFTYEEIAQMTAESTINLKEIGFGKDKPIAVFLGIPDFDRSNHFLASVFIRQLYFVLAKEATLNAGGKCTREVVFMLDEFGNLPAIESMANIITVCLGRNMRFNLVVQSYSQIEKLYGKDSETIIGNCGNQIYIQTNENQSAEHFSSLLGNETITNIHRSGSKMQLNKNYTEMYEEKPLLNPNELMDFTPGECAIKRVMKRTDLQGNEVTPTPIFNHGETRFPFRYQYMLDDFPTREASEIQIKGNKHINLKKRTFDIEEFFAKKQQKQQALEKGVVHKGFLEFTLSEVPKGAMVVEALERLNLYEDAEDLTVQEAINLLNTAEKNGEITAEEKDGLLNLIVMTKGA